MIVARGLSIHTSQREGAREAGWIDPVWVDDRQWPPKSRGPESLTRTTREETMSEGDQTGTITTKIPARFDRLPWSRFHWIVIAGLGTAWILDGSE
jgi:hypothetical protein